MIYWIWLSKLSGIGCHTSRILLKEFNDPKKIYQATYEELVKVKGIGPKKAKQIYEAKDLKQATKIMEDCKKNHINIMTINDNIYPQKAKNLEDMPILLYYKGIIKNQKKSVAIVGPRRCSKEARQSAIDLARNQTKQGITIISGMAKGIDSYAQTACLKAGGYTIAVLGNGLDICYPSEHKNLMKEIEKNGALISEYEPGTPAYKANFPRRNRIIAAFSDEIMIIAAKVGSGAMITGEYGKKYQRKIQFINTKY